MRTLNIMRIAFQSLKINRTRTFLSMLGVIVGVASLIIITSYGYGAQNSILSSIESLGSNVLIVLPGKGTNLMESVISQSETRKPLTYDDVKLLKGKLPGVYISPELNFNATIKYENREFTLPVVGTNEDIFDVSNYKIERGRKFVQNDILGYKYVCILGSKLSQKLFGNSNPLGSFVKIFDSNFLVIGTLQPIGSLGYIDMDNIAFVPITTLQTITGQRNLQVIFLKTPPEMEMEVLAARVRKLLIQSHKMENFSINSEDQYIELANSVTSILTITLTVISSIALIVGGIGIMNIMLASVAERTREIGIRKAVGAKNKDILMQFLFEAIFISAVGGLIGIVIGLIGSSISPQFLPTHISPTSIVVASLFSIFVGVFFGVYPARKAALLNPVDALRYE